MKTKIIAFLVLIVALIALVAFSRKATGIDKCESLTEAASKVKCWQEEITKAADSRGIDKAFDVLVAIDANDSTFAATCHDFVHLLGKKAYEKFEKGETFNVSDKTGYCAYGFYHGFMESLVSKKGSTDQARQFCDLVDRQLKDKSPSAELACYHGIGHGWTNVHDESLWGNERAMVNPALELCQQVTQDPEELKICATGVFDSISIGYYNQAYGLKIKQDDPMWLCREQKNEIFKTACYMDLSPAVNWLGNYNLRESLRYLDTVEEAYRPLVARTLAENSVRFLVKDKKEPIGEIKTCRDLGNKLANECLKGLASGIIQFGPIEREYVPGLEFCRSEILTESEKAACYQSIGEYINAKYAKDQVALICREIEAKYQNLCILD